MPRVLGRPLPHSRNDCQAYTGSRIDQAGGDAFVLADGAYGGTGCLIPHRRAPGQAEITGWGAIAGTHTSP
ncbi:hypothetical protein ACGF4C_35050 [Streptomyces sp. NPDC048197]|uniref:hypothetical protein n=1 Tax=Streptomyces sp. NPDC048197 TaxID=3365511 RepID=UPI003722F231